MNEIPLKVVRIIKKMDLCLKDLREQSHLFSIHSEQILDKILHVLARDNSIDEYSLRTTQDDIIDSISANNCIDIIRLCREYYAIKTMMCNYRKIWDRRIGEIAEKETIYGLAYEHIKVELIEADKSLKIFSEFIDRVYKTAINIK
jgi:hypothetical protein